MIQYVLVGIIFLGAVIYLFRFIRMQFSSKPDGHCEKCLPADPVNKKVSAK